MKRVPPLPMCTSAAGQGAGGSCKGTSPGTLGDTASYCMVLHVYYYSVLLTYSCMVLCLAHHCRYRYCSGAQVAGTPASVTAFT